MDPRNISEHHGDIFTSNASMIGITVNVVGAAGRGVAKAARDRHPDWYYYYKRACRYNQLDHYRMHLYRPEGNYRYWLLSIPTKAHWRDPSDLGRLKITLQHLRHQCIEHADDLRWSVLAIPPLGCSNGGLSYSDQVKPLIYEYLGGLKTQIEIWMF